LHRLEELIEAVSFDTTLYDAVRTTRYHYNNWKTNGEELYDIANDPMNSQTLLVMLLMQVFLIQCVIFLQLDGKMLCLQNIRKAFFTETPMVMVMAQEQIP
jgi:hypothetical protein